MNLSRSRHIVTCVVAIGLTAVLSGLVNPVLTSLSAQSRALSMPRIDYGEYNTVDQCVALKNRLSDSVNRTDPINDTFPWSLEEAHRRMPQSVISFVQECINKYDPQTIPIEDWLLLGELYLSVDDTVRAQALFERRLSALDSDSLRPRARVLDSIVRLYLKHTTPVGFAAIDSLSEILKGFPDSTETWREKMMRYIAVWEEALKHFDTLRGAQLSREIIALSDKLNAADRRTPFFTDSARHAVFFALEHLQRKEALDSLRQGKVQQFVDMKINNWVLATDEGGIAFPLPYGNEVSKIEGLWFSPEGNIIAGDVSKPTKGKVSIVLFYGGRSCYAAVYTGTGCHASFAVARRLQQSFPELEVIVIADHPPGHFGGNILATVEDEGWLMSKWLREFHNLHVPLAVERPLMMRLPEPDRRMVMLHASNPKNFRGKLGVFNNRMQPGETYVVDRNGTILDWRWSLERNNEQEIAQLISILISLPSK